MTIRPINVGRFLTVTSDAVRAGAITGKEMAERPNPQFEIRFNFQNDSSIEQIDQIQKRVTKRLNSNDPNEN